MAVTSITDDVLNLQVMAEIALGSLIQKIQFLNATTRGFDAIQKTANLYEVPFIKGGVTGVRVPGGEVTLTQPTASTVDIKTTQPHYAVELDESVLSGNISRFMQSYIDEGVRQLAREIETLALRTIAIDPLILQIVAGFDDVLGKDIIQFEDFQNARVFLKNAGFTDEEMQVILTHEAMNDALSESEFADANTSGFPGVTSTGQPAGRLFGFQPWSSSYVHNPISLNAGSVWNALVNGAIADGTIETIVYDAGAPDNGAQVGMVVDVASGQEKIVLGAIPTQTTVTGTIAPAKRGAYGSGPAGAIADNAALVGEASKTHLAWARSAIMHVFGPQELFDNFRGRKVEAEFEGVRLNILMEPNRKKNGGLILTMSSNFGMTAIRPDGVVKIIKKR